MLHFLDGNPALVRDIGGGTDGRPGITGSRLHKELFDIRAGNDALIELDIERTAANCCSTSSNAKANAPASPA